MAKTFRYYNPGQLLLLPPDLREWLPNDLQTFLYFSIPISSFQFYRSYQPAIPAIWV